MFSYLPKKGGEGGSRDLNDKKDEKDVKSAEPNPPAIAPQSPALFKSVVKEKSPFPHILVLPEDKNGDDLIVADLHGSLKCFDNLVASLGKNIRLVLAGDLIDRGKESVGLIEKFMKLNKAGKVYAARGNHEDLFIAYANRKLNNIKNAELDDKYLNQNGGQWASQLSDEKLKRYAEFFSQLPYVIHLPGEIPFHVVHANLLLSDDDLLNRIATNDLMLSPEEMDRITWERPKKNAVSKDGKRNKFSIPVYCGHSIGGGVRAETNHINLDVGTYEHGICVGIYHKANRAYISEFDILETDIRQYAFAKNCIGECVLHIEKNRVERKKLADKELLQKVLEEFKTISTTLNLGEGILDILRVLDLHLARDTRLFIFNLETKYQEEEKQWCAARRKLGMSSKPEDYVNFINANKTAEHCGRLLGLFIKFIYQRFPTRPIRCEHVSKLVTLESYDKCLVEPEAKAAASSETSVSTAVSTPASSAASTPPSTASISGLRSK